MTREELIEQTWAWAKESLIPENREICAATAIMLRADGEEIERLRMQLAACGVIANANTVESAAHCRDMHPDYWCDSVAAVADTVDREMALRARVAELEAAQRMRPMSDAPRDGTEGLMLHDDGRTFVLATIHGGVWHLDDMEDYPININELLGWWPLPAPEGGK